MEKQEQKEYYSIDVLHVVKTLWKQIWLIATCGILAAAIGFSIARFFITPTYSSYVKLYVNNTNFSVGEFSISSSQMDAAQKLVRTYGEILDSKNTLEQVSDMIDEKYDLDYDWHELHDMLTYGPSNDTEIMQVVVTCDNPYHACMIAESISDVLPERIAEVVKGATMEVVESAFVQTQKVAPSVTRYTAVGMILGLILSSVVVVIFALMDDTIHDESYVLRTYDYPILGKVPNLLGSSSKTYGYYAQSRRRTNTTRKDG